MYFVNSIIKLFIFLCKKYFSVPHTNTKSFKIISYLHKKTTIVSIALFMFTKSLKSNMYFGERLVFVLTTIKQTFEIPQQYSKYLITVWCLWVNDRARENILMKLFV